MNCDGEIAFKEVILKDSLILVKRYYLCFTVVLLMQLPVNLLSSPGPTGAYWGQQR